MSTPLVTTKTKLLIWLSWTQSHYNVIREVVYKLGWSTPLIKRLRIPLGVLMCYKFTSATTIRTNLFLSRLLSSSVPASWS